TRTTAWTSATATWAATACVCWCRFLDLVRHHCWCWAWARLAWLLWLRTRLLTWFRSCLGRAFTWPWLRRSTTSGTWASTAFLTHALLWGERVVPRTWPPTAWARTWRCGVLFGLERIVAWACCSWFWSSLWTWFWSCRLCGRLRGGRLCLRFWFHGLWFCRFGFCRFGFCRFGFGRFRSWFWRFFFGHFSLRFRFRCCGLRLFSRRFGLFRFRCSRLCRLRFRSGRLSWLRFCSRFWLLRRCRIFKFGTQAFHHWWFNS